MEVFIKEVSVGLGAVYHSFGQVWGGGKVGGGSYVHSCCFQIVLPLRNVSVWDLQVLETAALLALAQLCMEPSE